MPIKISNKTWNGREVAKETIVTWGKNLEFGALYEATELLQKQGYFVGRLDGDNPIGFSEFKIPFKWHTLTKKGKDVLCGVMVSDNFRAGDVKIIYFQ